MEQARYHRLITSKTEEIVVWQNFLTYNSIVQNEKFSVAHFIAYFFALKTFWSSNLRKTRLSRRKNIIFEAKPQPLSTYIGAYCAAVTAACSISAVMDGQFCLKRFVPLPAVSMASAVNVLCMRWNELRTGIEVYEKGGKVVGVSKVAAKQAVRDTTIVRAFLPIPMLLAPPCIMPFLERYKWVVASSYRHLFVNAVVCTLSFAFSLPLALALFPQESTIPTTAMEAEIQAKTNSDFLLYNKGL
ncbi:unnamed protein product [Strongylus vulgaris]|uniref:Tricarboxylate carrier n=1 Tax=Strongylus vulgaris TaxID=40348 RepID=A0A3P7I5J3_STRVU|nr:unnamed protein product [Strongylus vulgaris]